MLMVNMTPKKPNKIIGGKVESKGTMFESGHEWFSFAFLSKKNWKRSGLQNKSVDI